MSADRHNISRLGIVMLCLLGGGIEPVAAAELLLRRGNICVCESISIRGVNLPAEATALGPIGDSSVGWRLHKRHRDDGVTLGPAKNNPSNQPNQPGRPNPWIGYSFEIVTKVSGNPRKCLEIQLAKASGEFKGFKKDECEEGGGTFENGTCRYTHSWTGQKGNLDKAGKPVLDVSTKATCEAKNGTWDGSNCKLTFPFAGPDYGPDSAQGAVGAYENDKHGTLKRYLDDGTIVWKDRVGTNAPGVGSWMKADILSVVRGSHNNKYCFVHFVVDLERTATGSREAIEVKGNRNKVDASAVP